MNPPYGSPYHHYSSQPPPNPPPQPQYYPVQYSPHAHPHAYTTYQYAPMVMYPSHRPPPSEPSQSASSPQIPPAKRKRHSAGGDKSDEDTPASGSDNARTPAPQQTQGVTDLKKRTKTVRSILTTIGQSHLTRAPSSSLLSKGLATRAAAEKFAAMFCPIRYASGVSGVLFLLMSPFLLGTTGLPTL